MDDEELNNKLLQWGSQRIGQGRGRGCRSSAGHKAIGKEKKRESEDEFGENSREVRMKT